MHKSGYPAVPDFLTIRPKPASTDHHGGCAASSG